MAGVRKSLCNNLFARLLVRERVSVRLLRLIAKNGFALALISRSDLAALLQLRQQGSTLLLFVSLRDATNPNTIEKALKKASAEMGEVEVLIYNCRDNFTACAPLEMSYGLCWKHIMLR